MEGRKQTWSAWLSWLAWVSALLTCANSAQLKKFSLEELIPYQPQFYPSYVTGQWLKGDEFVITQGLPENDFILYNAETGTRNTLLSAANVTKLREKYLTDQLLYTDGEKARLILYSDYKSVFTNSFNASYAVYDFESGSVWELAEGAVLQGYLLDGSARPALAYVRGNNVYYVPDYSQPQKVVQLTRDGVPDLVYNGVPDYVYDEEILNSRNAMWFSTNGTYLAVASFNETLVDTYSYPYYGDPSSAESQYPAFKSIKYPKPGRKNPTVSLKAFPVTNSSLNYKGIELPAPVELVGEDHILGSVRWASDRHAVVLWLNRRQNVSVLVRCDVITTVCENKQVRSEKDGWIDISTGMFDDTGNLMIDISPAEYDNNRYKHVMLYNLSDNSTKDLTPGNGTVISIEAWDQNISTVYYRMAPAEEPWKTLLYSTSTSGDPKPVCLTCDLVHCPTVDTYFSQTNKYSLTFCSSSNIPYKTYMFDVENNKYNDWANNSVLEELLSEYVLPTPQFEIAELSSGVRAHIELIVPADLDNSTKHPLVVMFNAGPNQYMVSDRYLIDYNSYLASNRSYVVGLIDVRGSSHMGYNEIFAVNKKLGSVDVADALDAIKYLVSKYEFLDAERVGVYGWAAPSLELLAADDDQLLACAAGITPPVSLIYYDSMYSERYMGLLEDNAAGYEQANLLLNVEQFRNRELLLIHGSDDYNIHVQTSLLLSKVLQQAGIPFEQQIYTDGEHGLFSAYRHLHLTLDNFWTKCFQ